MNRRVLALAGAMVAVAASRCGSTRTPPPACSPIEGEKIAGLDPDVVWGFADLHAHPAIEVAFEGRLIWGSARDDAPIDATELPAIEPCPVETHDRNATSPIDRAVGNQVFPNLAGATGFAHGPVGSIGHRNVTAWPNARDVIHQQMNIASIRRAYEGGLRLMFASTTDDQVIGALLRGPNVIDGFVPDAAYDYRSARRQLDWIETMAFDNQTWMAIARTPAEARSIIQSGRLALVLSLEMEGLSATDVDRLLADYPVAHIIPIHLIDNDVGGTAANGPLFNSASAELSALYRVDAQPRRYMDLLQTPLSTRPMSWPQQVGSLTPAPLYAQLVPIPFSQYAPTYCYDSVEAARSSTATAVPYLQFGEENARGLCTTLEQCQRGERPGAERIRSLMERKLIVDLSHMGRQSAQETLAIDATYPFIASHGDVVRLCDGAGSGCSDTTMRTPGTERSLDANAARDVVRRGGVLGFGTGMQSYSARAVLSARGGPLFEMSPSHASVTLEPARPTLDATQPITTLHVSTTGGISSTNANAQPFVRVEMRARGDSRYRHQRRVVMAPLACSAQACSADVSLGTRDAEASSSTLLPPSCDALSCGAVSACSSDAYTMDDVEDVTLEWLFLSCDGACQSSFGSGEERQAQSTWDDDRAPAWTIDALAIDGDASPLVHIDARGTPIATLHKKRGTFVAYHRDDRPETANDVVASGHLLKVSLTSSPDTQLDGASPSSGGANVCVALRSRQGGTCASIAAPIPQGSTECPPDWVALDMRGEWASSVTLYAFARFSGNEADICGLDVSVLDWTDGAPLDIDEVRIEAAEDPLGRWIRRYAEIESAVAQGQLGALAIGTDFNGLNGLMDISELGLPAGATNPSSCSLTEASAPTALAPMRFRNSDGSLGATVSIEERGLATYGLLADMLAIVRAYPGCGQTVYDSVMLSAESTLRAWERIVDPNKAKTRSALPPATFACKVPP